MARTISTILSLMLIFSLSIPTFAEERESLTVYVPDSIEFTLATSNSINANRAREVSEWIDTGYEWRLSSIFYSWGDDSPTRSQFVGDVMQYLSLAGVNLEATFPLSHKNTDWNDLSVEYDDLGRPYFIQDDGIYMAWAYQHGLIEGDGVGNLYPDSFISELEAASLMARIAEKVTGVSIAAKYEEEKEHFAKEHPQYPHDALIDFYCNPLKDLPYLLNDGYYRERQESLAQFVKDIILMEDVIAVGHSAISPGVPDWGWQEWVAWCGYYNVAIQYTDTAFFDLAGNSRPLRFSGQFLPLFSEIGLEPVRLQPKPTTSE